MYGVPNATKPPKSTATKVLLIIGVALCLATGTGITVLGVHLATGDDSVTPGGGGPSPEPAGSTALPSRAGGPHQMVSDPCAPMKEIETSPKLAEYSPREPKDYTYFVSGSCDANADGYKVTAHVDIQVNFDSEYKGGAEYARGDYDSAMGVYDEKGDVTPVSGVGERAFAAPVSPTAEDTSWHLEVQDKNLGLRINGYTGKGKEADIELCKQLAQVYLEATLQG